MIAQFEHEKEKLFALRDFKSDAEQRVQELQTQLSKKKQILFDLQ
jgi:hypothetical protein